MTAAVGITGARGLLGATLLRTLPNAVAIKADVRDADALRRETAAIDGLGAIVHAAAMTDVAGCERDPEAAHAVNAAGTGHVVAAAAPVGAPVIYISTVSVFSGHRGGYTETDTPDPRNAYNVSKARGETHVLAYDRGIVLRLNLVGIHPDGSRGRNFMEWLVDSCAANRDLTLFTDVRINPLSNWTAAALIDRVLSAGPRSGILHLGTEDVVSKAEIGERVAAWRTGYAGTITRASVDAIGDGVPRPKEMWLDCRCSAEALGINLPRVDSEIATILTRYQA